MNMEEPWTVEKIEDIITAEKLCAEIPKDSCVDNKIPKDSSVDHIERVFKVCIIPVSVGK